ncbi:ABC transporter substrate-binding protein [Allostella vacuolata]|nr:ABC transporter substrate-binding protein [Stella vacuolata]
MRRRPTATALLLLAAVGLSAEPASAQDKTLRVALQSDVRTLDPVWTNQTIASIHGNMIFDRLFSPDAQMVPQPQMVESWTVSDDRKTYVFTLREGLKFHDGSPVTSRDAIASMRRWGARDGAGKQLMSFTADIVARDDRTFEWTLKEPYGLVIETMGKLGPSLPAIMREKEALTDPSQQVTEMIGSGPFVFKRDEWVPGSKTVYVKNPNYVPRKEPASGHAGGKVVKVDRVEFVWLADPQTAQAALAAGEIDYLENPQIDFLPILEATPGVKLDTHPAQGTQGIIQLNHLHPPFDNVKARQAMLHIVSNQDFLDTIAPDKRLQRPCFSYLGCGTPMETDAGSEPYRAPKDYRKAEQLFKEAGYKGEPITILHATEHQYINPANLVLIQQMRKAGFLKLDVQAMDWGAVVSRRTRKEPPAQGGWNIFVTGLAVVTASSPSTNPSLDMSCEKAWFGWACDPAMEQLRRDWAFAPDAAERRRLAADISRRAYEVVPYVPYAQWVNPAAYRADRITGVLSVPQVPVMWNIEKK